MACCAFAVVLLMQLLAPLARLRDRLFGAPAVEESAAAWRPSGIAPTAVVGRLRWRRGLLAIVALELAVLVGSYQYWQLAQSDAPAAGAMTFAEALHASWCGSGPLAPDERG